MVAPKRLYRANEKNSVIGGVCAGFADYFNIDPVIVRVLWLAFALTGAGIILYLLFWAIVPRKR